MINEQKHKNEEKEERKSNRRKSNRRKSNKRKSAPQAWRNKGGGIRRKKIGIQSLEEIRAVKIFATEESLPASHLLYAKIFGHGPHRDIMKNFSPLHAILRRMNASKESIPVLDFILHQGPDLVHLSDGVSPLYEWLSKRLISCWWNDEHDIFGHNNVDTYG